MAWEVVQDEHPADAVLGHAGGLAGPLLMLLHRSDTYRLTTLVVHGATAWCRRCRRPPDLQPHGPTRLQGDLRQMRR